MQLKFQKLSHRATAPARATDGAAAFDVTTIEAGEVMPRSAHTFRTGLAFEVPAGYVMLAFSRSGHGFKHGLRLVNAVGVIDSDYRGELLVRLQNDTGTPFSFDQGDRVAQVMILALPDVEIIEADELGSTRRGSSGLGSTGQ